MLSTISTVSLGSSVLRSFTPPPALYLPQSVVAAWESENPYHGKRSKRTPAQRAGLAYQKRIEKFCTSRDGQWVVRCGVWYCYCDVNGRRRYCQPDILLLDHQNRCAVVVEVKLRWTSDAWWQLQRLYIPVLRRALQEWTLIPLCITKSFDPAIPAPEEVRFCDDLFDSSPGAFNLMVVR